MIRQHLCLPKYDWCVDILYNAWPIDADNILEELWDMGCSEDNVYKACRLLKSGKPNQGLTYSNKHSHRSLIVVGYADSVGEFLSTVIHEVDHLTDHISQCYDIPYASEENSYLIGDIAKRVYEDAAMVVARFLGHL